jgi:predicted enzyme related to lactoylglutathione lyase
MTATGTYAPGAPSRAELTSSDPAAVRAFYGELLGSRFAEVASIEPAGDGQPSTWTSYLYVDDIEQTLDRITAAGGKAVRPPRTSADGRRVAAFTDSAGVILGLLELGSARPRAACESVVPVWGELITDDVEASAAFYGAVFGWELGGPEGSLNRREWLVGGQPIAGLLPRPPAMPPDMPVYWDTWFGAGDADAVAGLAPGLGGALLMGPVDIERGRLAVLTDPSGAVFSVLTPTKGKRA